MEVVDYVVVGSGCAGSMAAQTLIEAGKHVTMLDGGQVNPDYDRAVPNKDYITLRHTDPMQYKYLIGEQAEGAAWGEIGKGAQVTPPRGHMTRSVDRYLPVDSKTFSPLESLGYGGLGIGWGLQCWEYSAADAAAAGLDFEKLSHAYELVAKRIGVSATRDEAADYTLGNLETYQPSPEMDRNHRLIYSKYQRRKKRLTAAGYILGRTPLALITNDTNGRKGYQYRDMDYYDDNGHSAWRPWMTVDELKKHKNFTYVGGYLVTSFREHGDVVEITCLSLADDQPKTFYARTLVLAAGALGSARIVLRALGQKQDRLPVLCNPYTYIPCIQPRLVGKGAEARKLGLAQLSLFQDPKRAHYGFSVASFYSYQSLMLLRIIRQLPFNLVDARIIMRYLMSGIEIMGVHHPDAGSSRNYVQLAPDATTPTGDRLRVVYELGKEQLAEQRQREDGFVKVMRGLGTYALARINPGYGSSIHYAGTLPFSDADKPLTLARNGRLHGTKRVYVVDSSGFTYLPAQGLTFTLLANAHMIAEGITDAS